MPIKDMEKAYDRLKCDFIKKCLTDLDFCNRLNDNVVYYYNLF